MTGSGTAPTLTDLHRLGAQLQRDSELSLAELRQRDHALGRGCEGLDDSASLMHWLQRVGDPEPPAAGAITEQGLALMLYCCALATGALAMGGFLLASDRGLVNVFLFLALFVALQCLLSCVAAFALWQSCRGSPPAVLPINPARLLAARAWPDQRFWRESAAALRLLVLRYGQVLALCFTCGALIAFLLLLSIKDFSFVWSSTLGISEAAVERSVAVLAGPWSSIAPQALPGAALVADTRFNPALPDLGGMSDQSRRGWWPFLFACMVCYALLPRLLLWLVARVCFGRELRRAFLHFPGAEAVLHRMRAPLVDTRADADSLPTDTANTPAEMDESLMWLDWAGAGPAQPGWQLASVPPGNRLAAGLGAAADDAQAVAAINAYRPEHLLVTVKGWEPPLADLADALAGIDGVGRCTLFLVTLPDRPVGAAQLSDWQGFARGLAFRRVDVEALED